jgi:hypothetical protein
MQKPSKELMYALNATWQAIGPDLMQCAEETGGELDNEEVVEACFDADRIVVYGGDHGKSSQDEFRTMIRETSYREALQHVIKHMPCPFV